MKKIRKVVLRGTGRLRLLLEMLELTLRAQVWWVAMRIAAAGN